MFIMLIAVVDVFLLSLVNVGICASVEAHKTNANEGHRRNYSRRLLTRRRVMRDICRGVYFLSIRNRATRNSSVGYSHDRLVTMGATHGALHINFTVVIPAAPSP